MFLHFVVVTFSPSKSK